MSEGVYTTGNRTRSGDEAGSPVVGGSEYPDKSRVRYRVSDAAAPTTPSLPIDAPSPPTKLGAAAALRGSRTLLNWQLVPTDPPPGGTIIIPPTFTDFAWRWQKHSPGLAPPPTGGVPVFGSDGGLTNPGSPYFGSANDEGFFFIQQPIPSGGGSYTGFLQPLMAKGGVGPLLDPAATPVWTLVVEWVSKPVDVNGTPGGTFGIDGLIHSTSSTMPNPPRYTAQPIVGNSYTASPWILYVTWAGTWLGAPGNWVLAATATLHLIYGGSGGPTASLQWEPGGGGLLEGLPGSGDTITEYAATTVIEFDNTTNRIVLAEGDPAFSHISIPGGYTPPGWTVGTTPEGWAYVGNLGVGNPGAWPGDYNGYSETFGSGNMGPYYWSSYRQLNGFLRSVVIIPESAADTVTLLSERSIVPGTGPVVPNVKFRAGDAASKPLSAELSEYTHYWPLDDPSPGPMYDLLAGSYLTVVNPTFASFQQDDGITNPLAPTHTKSLKIGPNTGRGLGAYLTWAGRGPRPSLGTGALGHDLTIGMWIKWYGPIGQLNGHSILQGSLTTFGFGNVQTFNVGLWTFAEPFGVSFSTWDSVAHTMFTLKTTDFDWPADYVLDWGAGPGNGIPTPKYATPIPYKEPLWAYLAVVLRTVSGQMTQEIWVDGVLLAQQDGSNNGWGVDSALTYVGMTLQTSNLQHLSLWPFALSHDALAGFA